MNKQDAFTLATHRARRELGYGKPPKQAVEIAAKFFGLSAAAKTRLFKQIDKEARTIL